MMNKEMNAEIATYAPADDHTLELIAQRRAVDAMYHWRFWHRHVLSDGTPVRPNIQTCKDYIIALRDGVITQDDRVAITEGSYRVVE